MLAPAYPIETARLLLRPYDPTADVDGMHAYLSLPEVCRYVSLEPQTRAGVAERLAKPHFARTVLEEPGQELYLAIVERDSARVVGELLVKWLDGTNAEIGYVVHPDVQGRGYATEAAAAALGLVFERLGLHRAIGRIDQRNSASAAVLTKLGMRQEAVFVEDEWFKGEWSTEVRFAILDREWRALRS